MDDALPPPLSIVISTVDGWPHIDSCLGSVEEAARRVGAEVIVLDGSGRPPPPEDRLSPLTSWREAPGENVFSLRTAGYELARAPIVAVTEDHCFVPPDWCTRMLVSHAEHPDAAAIGGAVENGATHAVMDWASFLVVQNPHMHPLASGDATRIAGAVNVSYKREALAGLRDEAGIGAVDLLHQRRLRASGARLIADGRIRVAHVQSLGFGGTTAAHYHAGRTMAGAWRQAMSVAQWMRLVGIFLIPIPRFGRIALRSMRKGYTRQLVPAIPAMVWLLYSQAVGQFIGYLRGPGNSPAKVP